MTTNPSRSPRPIVVLLVDDQPIIGAAIQGMLAREKGITVHFCQDAQNALATARRVAPTIILQDLNMPGLSGLELIERYRADPATASVPIIVLSAMEDADSKTEAYALGADDYLVKIPDKFDLIERIQHLVRSTEPAGTQASRFDEVTVVEVGRTIDEVGRITDEVGRITDDPPRRITGVGAAAGSGADLEVHIKPTLPLQDLLREGLLRGSRTGRLDGRPVPLLRGIALVAKLGEGAMGAVYYGIHTRLQCEVAVKVLPPHLASGRPHLVERFYREARVAARIQSANLVRVLDVDEDEGIVFLVMEFVAGTTARQYADRHREPGVNALPERHALEICRAAANGLTAAHEAGVVHRDIKPENILIPRSGSRSGDHLGRAKLADLGIARFDESDSTLTNAGATLGTPGFMAPEQILDARSVGKPADVWSLGVTLYSLLTGAVPFRGTTTIEVAMATVNDEATPLLERRPGIAAPTVKLIDRCLAKDARGRFADGAVLRDALEVCLDASAAPPEAQRAAVERIAAL
jgi:CheY-like chemotaxis protein